MAWGNMRRSTETVQRPGASKCTECVFSSADGVQGVGHSANQRRLSRERCRDAFDLAVHGRPFALLDCLTNTRHRFHAIAGVVARGIKEMRIPAALGKPFWSRQRAFGLEQSLVECFECRCTSSSGLNDATSLDPLAIRLLVMLRRAIQ